MKNIYQNSTDQEWKAHFRVYLESTTLDHIDYASLTDSFSKTVEALSSPDSVFGKFKQEHGEWEEYSFHNSGWGPGPSGRIISHAMREMGDALESLDQSMERGALSRNPNTKLPYLFLSALDEFKEFIREIEGQSLDPDDLLAPYITNLKNNCDKFASLDMNYEDQDQVFDGYLPEDIKVYLRQKLFRQHPRAWEVVQSGAAPFLNTKFKGQQPLRFSLRQLEKESEQAFSHHFANIPGKSPEEHREFLDQMLDSKMDNPVVKAAYDEIVASEDYKHTQVEHAKAELMRELDALEDKVKPLLKNEKEFIGAINMAKLLRMSGEAKGMASEKTESLQTLSGKLQDCLNMKDQRRFYHNMRGSSNPHSNFFKDESVSQNLVSNIYQLLEKHTELSQDDLDNSGLFERVSRSVDSSFRLR